MAGARPFIVFTAVRSGSAWLIDLLSSHPEVLAYGELFGMEGAEFTEYGSPGMVFYEDLDGAKGGPALGPSPQRSRYLDQLYAPHPRIGAIGFKLVYGQAARRPGLLHELSARRVRVVHLLRANFLEAVISLETARAIGVYHVTRGQDAPLVPVRVNVDELRTRLDLQDQILLDARCRLERRGFTLTEVFYEELLHRRTETMARVLEFLHVDPSVELDSRFARTPGSLAERIENLGEVREALSGTRFEWMLGAVSPQEPVASSAR